MKIYCSGIGGIGLSAYAALQRTNGHDVLGSDRSDSALLDDLRSQGITVILKQDGSGVPADVDLFVYSEAIPEDAPERARARDLGIPERSYPEAVSELTKDHRLIAVCGTHGKSSTTAMITRLLLETGHDPTVIIGTKCKELNGRNWRRGKSDLFVLEACEYRRSFLNYSPDILLLTNCDGDHFDYYSSMEDYESAFVEIAKKLPKDGVVITHGRDPSCVAVSKASGRRMIDADSFPALTLQTPGAHMQENAKLALALADFLKIPKADAERAASSFAGTWRRMEVKGETTAGVTVLDDYAHHPKEIRATVAAIRGAYPKRRLICVFQPHTHDRTLKLYDDFLPSFRDADLLVVTNVYDARSQIEKGIVDLPKFLKDIERESGVHTINGETLMHTEKLLQSGILKAGDVLLFMGAGDITNLATKMVAR